MKRTIICAFLIIFISLTHANETKWFHNALFYEIFVRAFNDSDGNGVGDINGVTEKLDYIESLGVKGIWLMPIFHSPSPHGYDTYDYYKINPIYGTEADLIKLIDEAGKRDIRIILDLVINHTGRQQEWFMKSVLKEEPYTDYFVWKKEKPEGDWLSWNYNKKRDEWYYSAFSQNMPDLNFRNPSVRESIKEVAKYWLNKGIAGFRLDAAKHIIENGPGTLQTDTPETIQWWEEFSSYVHSVDPDALLIGEVWSSAEKVAQYYANGKGLDLCFDFDGASAILKTGAKGSIVAYQESLNKKKNLFAPTTFYAPFISNHDTIRTMNILKNNFNKAKTAAMLLLTSPGTPFIYYGEEIGMYQTETGRNDNAKRTIMQWTNGTNAGFTQAKKSRHQASIYTNPYNVRAQSYKKSSLLNLYRRVGTLRSSYPALYSENYEFINNDQKIVAFYKGSRADKSRILVLSNQQEKASVFPLPKLNGVYHELISDKRIKVNGKIRLGAGDNLLLLVED